MKIFLHIFIASICLIGCQSDKKQSAVTDTPQAKQVQEKTRPAQQPAVNQGEIDITQVDQDIASRPGRAPHPELPWYHNAAAYQVNTRQFSPAGTFLEVSRHIPRLTSLGMKILNIMPIHPIGKANRKGALGSPYNVMDYMTVHPDYGTIEDFKRLVQTAHANNMKVIIDWVGYSTALDHNWTKNNSTFYSTKAGKPALAADKNGRPLAGLKTATLNYDNAELRKAMIDAMRFWVTECDVDGFRCIDAEQIPNDFWQDAKSSLAADKKELFWIADGDNPRLHEVFDISSDNTLQSILANVAQGKAGTDKIESYLNQQAKALPKDGYRLSFTTNQKLNAQKGPGAEQFGANEMVAAVVANTLTGLPMLYNGQEAGLDQQLDPFKKDNILWKNKKLSRLYQKLFIMKQTNKAVWNGEFGSQPDIFHAQGGQIGYLREKGPDAILILANFGDEPATIRVDVKKTNMTDIYSRKTIDFSKVVNVTVPAHGYMYFQK